MLLNKTAHKQVIFHNLLGCRVGTCCANRSSFNIYNSVVFPALSNPKNSSFPDFFHNPEKKYMDVHYDHFKYI